MGCTRRHSPQHAPLKVKSVSKKEKDKTYYQNKVIMVGTHTLFHTHMDHKKRQGVGGWVGLNSRVTFARGSGRF